MCDSDCVEWLKARALAEYEAAESAARSPKRRANEPLIRRRATALGWAAGELQAHQRTREDPTWTPTAEHCSQQQQMLEQLALNIP